MEQEVRNDINGPSAHRETVARYFSTKTKFWTLVYSQENGACNDYMGFHMRRRRDLVLKCLSDCQRPGGVVLDVGCGAGALVVAMAGMEHQVHGVDISPGMVAKARKYAEEQGLDPEHIRLGAVETIPYADSFFDVATCVGVLEYVSDEKAALSELKRVVKADGRIILTLPNIFKLQNLLDPYYWFVRALKYLTRNKSLACRGASQAAGIGQISSNANCSNRRYSYRQLKKMLADSALVPVDLVGLGYGPFTFWRKKLFSEEFSKQASDSLENTFKRVSPGLGKYFANRWVICLKKIEE